MAELRFHSIAHGMSFKDTVKTILEVEFGEPERAKANWVRPLPSHVSWLPNP
jgi:hypothetical protein